MKTLLRMRINFPVSTAYFKNIQGNNINLRVKLNILPTESHRCVGLSGRNHFFMSSTLRARAEAGGSANKGAWPCPGLQFADIGSFE